MRIVHTEASCGWGGQEMRVLLEAKALRDRSHEVFIVSNSNSAIMRNDPDSTFKRSANLRRKRLAALLSLRATLLELRPDVVVCHSSTDHWLTAAARLTLSRRYPIVRARHIGTPIRRNLFTDWLYQGGCEAVITTSESIRDAMVEQNLLPPAKVLSVPTGIDPHEFGIVPKDIARRQLGLPMTGLLVGIIATLRSWKGHADLLSAFSKISADATLVIVGDGPQRRALENQSLELGIAQRTLFVGQQKSVAPWFSALDLFALPSHANEGVPQAILQAMATGLPILSCPVGGIPEAMKSYSCKRFVAARNPKELSQTLNEMLSTLDEYPSRNDLRQAPYSVAGMTDACEHLYTSVIENFRYPDGHA